MCRYISFHAPACPTCAVCNLEQTNAMAREVMRLLEVKLKLGGCIRDHLSKLCSVCSWMHCFAWLGMVVENRNWLITCRAA